MNGEGNVLLLPLFLMFPFLVRSSVWTDQKICDVFRSSHRLKSVEESLNFASHLAGNGRITDDLHPDQLQIKTIVIEIQNRSRLRNSNKLSLPSRNVVQVHQSNIHQEMLAM